MYKNLPELPGIYKFLDKNKHIIYIGKAKNLKKRVTSYFLGKHTNNKLKTLVKQITSIEFTIVETETDALLLENSLIKQNQPKYNMMLKDGKSYPFICIIDEEFPRIIMDRNKSYNGKYFGPYSSYQTVNTLLELFHNIYPLRTCSLNLSKENIAIKKYKACLEFQIGNCNAPCINNETKKNYQFYIDECENILKGKLQGTKQNLKAQMQFFATNYEFEKAEIIKNKLKSLENYQSKSTIVSQTLNKISVITIITLNENTVLNHLEIENGQVISTINKIINSNAEDDLSTIFEKYVISINPDLINQTIISNQNSEYLPSNIKIEQPKVGEKLKLLEISIKNCFAVINEKQKSSTVNKKNTGFSILEQAKKDLHLKEIPIHIECFDNSNIQGTTPVASMVCFKNSIPSKKDYRHFHIKTVVGANDFASMKEIVTRRYKRLIEESEKLPQLIIIDGGKGQLSSAFSALKELNLEGKVAIISIAKRLEEIYYPGDEHPLYLNKNSSTLKLIQRLRNEAHRFAITFHKSQRNKNTLTLEVSKTKGLGEKTIDLLLTKYKSMKKAKEANLEELIKLIGKSKTELLLKK